MSFGRFKDDNNSSKSSASSESSGDIAYSSGSSSGNRKEAYISKGSKIVGNLQFSGPIELDGHVEGEVVAQDKLTVGESAIINAKLSGTEVVVKGTVNGDIYASKRIILRKPARVVGSLTTAILVVDEGVVVEGKIAMIAAEKKSQESNSTESKSSAGTAEANLKPVESKPGVSKTGIAVVS